MIGYYVHHRGPAHLHRMQRVADRLDTPMCVLSSLPPPARCEVPWVWLADDTASRSVVDPAARGTLHWVPRHDAGLLARMHQISAWVERARPALVVVDVSVEVALLVRLLGVPVVVVAQPGDEDDRAYRTAYDLADAIVAPWSPGLGLEEWPARWSAKATHVGAFSRFDGRARWRGLREPSEVPRGLLLWGTEDDATVQQLARRLQEATPGWSWEVAGRGRLHGPAHLWRALCTADVVVADAGQDTVADLAAARGHAVVVADEHLVDGQRHTARALDRAGLAVGLERWPADEAWPAVLRAARDRGGSTWSRWADGRGAERMAGALEGLVSRLGPRPVRVHA